MTEIDLSLRGLVLTMCAMGPDRLARIADRLRENAVGCVDVDERQTLIALAADIDRLAEHRPQVR